MSTAASTCCEHKTTHHCPRAPRGRVRRGIAELAESVGHIGNPNFLTPAHPFDATHGWYHVFREVCGDVAVFLLLFFGSAQWRTPLTWWIGLILMLGYYGPFRIGEPALPPLSAPNTPAAITQVVMALLSLAALFVARAAFSPTKDIFA